MASDCPSALDELVLSDHLHLLHSLVCRASLHRDALHRDGYDVADASGAGLVGLVQAHRNYTDATGMPFTSFAEQCIRKALMSERRVEARALGRNDVTARRLSRAIKKVEGMHGRAATASEVAEELGVPIAEYADMREDARLAEYVYLDAAPAGDDGECFSAHDVVADESAVRPDRAAETRELMEAVLERLQSMPHLDKTLIFRHYLEGESVSDIARDVRLRPASVRRILDSGVLVLRAFLAARNYCDAAVPFTSTHVEPIRAER